MEQPRTSEHLIPFLIVLPLSYVVCLLSLLFWLLFMYSTKLANGTLPLYERCIIVCSKYIHMKV